MTKPYEQAQRIPLIGLQDRRRKLTEEDKEDIKAGHKRGEAIHAIARVYKGKCSRRLIQLTIYPERLISLQDKHRKEQVWKKYYNRKQLTQSARNWRNYKYKLYKDKLKENALTFNSTKTN